MRTLAAAITAEKNKTAGAKPVWVLKLPRAGTIPLYLSDRPVDIMAPDLSSQTTLPWVSSWSSIREGVTNGLGELSVGDFDLHVLADPAADQNIIYQVDQYDVETDLAELLLAFEGVNEAALVLFSGYIKEISIDKNDAGVSLRLQDATLKLQGTLGTVLDTATYPLADPDHIGKLLPIVYGSVAKLPALCVDAGWVTSLANQALSTDTTILVSELPSTSVVGKTFYVDAEQVTVTAADTVTRVLTVTRGANSTSIANHSMGSVVIEKKATPIVFLLSDHALDTIGDIYIRVAGVDVNITTSVTKYLGTPANQLATYPGKAAITIATTPAVMQQIWLAINNALAVDQGNHTHPTSTSVTAVTMDTYFDYSIGLWPWVNLRPDKAYDGNYSTYCDPSNFTLVSFKRSAAYSGSGTPLNLRLAINYEATQSDYDAGPVEIYISGQLVYSSRLPNQAKNTWYSGWFPITSFSQIYATGNTYARIQPSHYSSTGRFYEIYWEVQTGTPTTYSPAAGVALTGDLSLIGNSIANVYTMDQLMASVARATVATPLLAINDILTRSGQPIATGSSSITTAINGAITVQQPAVYWLSRIAFESWAMFKVSGAGSKLIPRGITASQKTISNAMLRGYTRRKSAYEDIINKIDLKYDLDYSNTTSDPYRQTISAEDATSLARYGVQDRPDLFNCQFITSSTIAQALLNAYLAWYCIRHWVYEAEVFLDNIEIEYADTITLGFINGSPVAVVREDRITPGDDSEPDTITLVVEV